MYETFDIVTHLLGDLIPENKRKVPFTVKVNMARGRDGERIVYATKTVKAYVCDGQICVSYTDIMEAEEVPAPKEKAEKSKK